MYLSSIDHILVLSMEYAHVHIVILDALSSCIIVAIKLSAPPVAVAFSNLKTILIVLVTEILHKKITLQNNSKLYITILFYY